MVLLTQCMHLVNCDTEQCLHTHENTKCFACWLEIRVITNSRISKSPQVRTTFYLSYRKLKSFFDTESSPVKQISKTSIFQYFCSSMRCMTLSCYPTISSKGLWKLTWLLDPLHTSSLSYKPKIMLGIFN